MKSQCFEKSKSIRNSKIGIAYITLVVSQIVLLFTSCSSNQITPQTAKRPIEVPALSQEFPNLPVGLIGKWSKFNNNTSEILVRFEKEVAKVKLELKDGTIQDSKMPPQGFYWKQINKIDDPVVLNIIGIPKDGSKELVYKNRNFEFHTLYTVFFQPNNAGEQEIKIQMKEQYDGHFISKALMDIDGKLVEMKKTDEVTFSYQTKLPASPTAKVYLYNQNGDFFTFHDLTMTFAGEHRKYYCPYLELFTEFSICSTDLDGGDYRLEHLLDIPYPETKEDGDYTKFKFINKNSSSSVNLLSVSKDARLFFLTSQWVRKSDYDANIFVNGWRVQNTTLTDYLIFDSQDRSYHTIGTHYKYELFPWNSRGPFLIEKGNIVLPVRWYDDRVVCSLVTKIDKEVRDGEVDTGKLNFETGVEDAFSPYATAKGIEVDLSTFECKDSQEFKPLSPFMSFADDSTDIIGYDDINKKTDSQNFSLDWLSNFNISYSTGTSLLSDMNHTKEYHMDDLFKQIISKEMKVFHSYYCGSKIENGKRIVYISFMGIKPPKAWNMTSRISDIDWVYSSETHLVIFSLDFDSGKITKIIENRKPPMTEFSKDIPMKFYIYLGSSDLPTKTWVSGLNAYQLSAYSENAKPIKEAYSFYDSSKIINYPAMETLKSGGYIR